MFSRIINTIDELKNFTLGNLSDYLQKEFNNKQIVIYGAGAFGQEIFNLLSANNISAKAFLDIKAKGELFNIPVIHPSIYENKAVIVVLAIVLNKKTRNEITEFLYKLGYKTIIDAQKIRALYIELENEHTYEYFKTNQENILKPLDFLADEESKKTYTQNVIAHISRNYENTFETDEENQYFINNIPFKKGFSRFIDCGAYIGDTFLKLAEQNLIVQEYIGFEPVLDVFNQLSKNLSTKKIKAMALPAAVSDKMQIIKFNSKHGSGAINENGDTSVICVKLDDVLYNYKPSFIKMDIEGEEIKALNGAKNLILKSRPDLAICVYHYINHFWEIPNMLHDWNLGYKFYLRTHSSACMETVLYAVGEN